MPVTPRRADDEGDDQSNVSLAGPSVIRSHSSTAYSDSAVSTSRADLAAKALPISVEVQGLGKQPIGNGSVDLAAVINGKTNTAPFAATMKDSHILNRRSSSLAESASNSLTATMQSKANPMEVTSPPTSHGLLSPPPSDATLQRPPLSLKAQGKVKAVDLPAMSTKAADIGSSSAPLPGSQVVLSHSQLFREASPPMTGDKSNQVTLAALKSELNHEEGGLIPLAAVIERVVSEAYETLQNLGETISSLPSASKRSRIFHAALDLRGQMIKLYVLIKWAKGANHMQHITNVVGLTHEQSFQTVDARDHIKETRGLLPNARGRNHDIITAIDVLAAGEPQGLPESIVDEAIPPKPLTDCQVKSIVEELDQALRTRLTSRETLPLALQPSASYRIHAGRVELAAEDLFSVTLTLSGDGNDDRWYLLTISFDYNITGLGKERFPRDLWESQREGFIAQTNEILAPRQGESEEKVVGRHASVQQEAPIVRLYYFLQSQALEYQLDILAYQLSELSRSSWRGSVVWHWEQRLLVVKYWLNFQTSASGTQKGEKSKWNPVREGVLRLQVVSEQEASAGDNILTYLSCKADGKVEQQEDSMVQSHVQDRENHLRLVMRWELSTHLASYQNGQAELSATINAQDLNAEAILRDVTARHAELALRALKDRLSRSWGIQAALKSSDGSIEQQSDDRGAALIIKLHETLRVRLHLEAKTGRMSLTRTASSLRPQLQRPVASNCQVTLLPSLSGSSLTARCKEATRLLNATPEATADILLRLRITAICDSLETKAAQFGLACLRRLNLSQEEYVKFDNAQPSSLLFLPLAQCPTFHLVIVVRDYGIEVGLMSAMPLIYADGTIGTSLVVQSLQWLDIVRLLSSSPSLGKRRRGEEVHSHSNGAPARTRATSSAALLQGPDLVRLHSYATALTLSAQIESQLQLRGTPFVYIPSDARRTLSRPAKALETSIDYQRGQSLVPTITLRTTDLFGPTASALLRRSAVLKMKDFWNPQRCQACLVVRLRFNTKYTKKFKSKGGSDSANLVRTTSMSSVSSERNGVTHSGSMLDMQSSTIIFLTRKVSQAMDIFHLEWSRVAKIVSLAAHILQDCPHLTLLSLDLEQVRFAYAGRDDRHRLICQVNWNSMEATLVGYRLLFSSSSSADLSERNPHSLIARHLERLLNASTTTLPDWSAFITLLDHTLHIVSILAPLVLDDHDTLQQAGDVSRPDVELITATWYRIIIAESHTLVVRLTKDGKACISDAAAAAIEGAASGDDTSVADSGNDSAIWAPHPIPQLKEIMARFGSKGAMVFDDTMLLPASKMGLLTEFIEEINDIVMVTEGLK